VPADQPTIQAGVDAAALGDTVLVAPGTYYGAPGSLNCVVLDKGVALISEGGAAVTRIDGEGVRRVLSSDTKQAGRVIQGFTISNGYATTGAGMFVRESGSLAILDNIVVDNVAQGSGGGLETYGLSAPVVRGNTFEGNTAHSGSACRMDSYRTTFDSNTVVNNNSPYSALHITEFYGAFYMTNCLVANNGGTGLYVDAQCGDLVEIRRSTFSGNAWQIETWNFLYVLLEQTIVDGSISVKSDEYWCLETSVTFNYMDLLGIVWGYGFHTAWNQPNLMLDPLFCDPIGGDFSVAHSSPCLPQNNPWGRQIGAFGQGCGGPVSLTPETWARIKAKYR
jgi:parallel beta-helix repeat protein